MILLEYTYLNIASLSQCGRGRKDNYMDKYIFIVIKGVDSKTHWEQKESMICEWEKKNNQKNVLNLELFSLIQREPGSVQSVRKVQPFLSRHREWKQWLIIVSLGSQWLKEHFEQSGTKNTDLSSRTFLDHSNFYGSDHAVIPVGQSILKRSRGWMDGHWIRDEGGKN